MEEQGRLGLVHIYTGDGKGKTTAAMGLASRAMGRGLKVKIIQFFKRDTGELMPMRQLGASYEQFKPLHPFFRDYASDALADLKSGFGEFWEEQVREIQENQYNLVVIDELGPALAFDIVPQETILNFLDKRPRDLELVLTGRGFPQSILARGDYITEMRLVNHPFTRGVHARRGIEF
jgi:cob(I)alamin adenosyltransferase